MFIADLHIHSKYSRATSKECIPEHLELWARRKGIDLIGTGDFTHPVWREELKEKLELAEEGLYRLKDAYRLKDDTADDSRIPRFVVSGEISSIYKKNDRVRKVHNLILLPSLEAAEVLAHKLEQIGNLHSDGRPILGLDSRDLLEITLEVCPDAIFIPAHIWTPHFSLFGAFSGFDTIEECFEDMTPYIHALETGLSSDPPMNWRLSALDSYALVSNSDAHSPSKLGREANLFDTEMRYPAIAHALQEKESRGLLGTIEFFPEEGKYHFDGHRACKLCLKPSESVQAAGICPSCGKKLTIGVLHRVEQLADRAEGYVMPHARQFESLIPLPEVIAASTGFSAAGVKVKARYEALLHSLGAEFYILRQAPLEEIERVAGPCVAEGVRRMRCGRVELSPGYDGEYGRIHLLDQSEIDALSGQLCFFGGQTRKKKEQTVAQAKSVTQKAAESAARMEVASQESVTKQGALQGLNEEQEAAAKAEESTVAVIAGPGTGKTKTLISRIAYLIENCGVHPSDITAVTFTNKAATEMRTRLESHFGGKKAIKGITIGTFHAICLQLLSEQAPVTLLDEFEASAIAQEVLREKQQKLTAKRFLQAISAQKNGIAVDPPLPDGLFEAYGTRLEQYGVLDFDDLLLRAGELFSDQKETEIKRRAFPYLLVDEFQDINDLQYRLIQAWGEKSKSIFVIGDPDQSIYGFRGSNAHCFDRFLQDYPNTRKIRLAKNYRSTPEIVACALSAITASGDHYERNLDAQASEGIPVRLLTAKDEFNEAVFLAKEINRMVGGVDMLDTEVMAARRNEEQMGFSDIAILYRTHRQAEVLEKCLQKEGIPYVVAGKEESLLADPVVRGTVCFFRSLLEPRDRVSLHTCLKEIFHCSSELLARMRSVQSEQPLEKTIADMDPSSKEAEALSAWKALVTQFQPKVQKEKPRKLLEAWMQESGVEANERMERLLRIAVFHSNMPQLLQNLLLGREGDVYRSGTKRYVPDAVTLTTIHGAKGLEYPVVFLSGVKQGLLPLEGPGRENDYEEERRLFYVGITRAKKELILLTGPEPSVFLQSIPRASLRVGQAAELKPSYAGTQLRLF